MLTLYVGASNVIELTGLRNSITLAYDNAATVTVTLTDQAGANLTGETFPKALAYVAASSGNYRATLSANLAIAERGRYRAVLDVTGSGGEKDKRRLEVLAVYRDD